MGSTTAAMARGYSILVLAIVASASLVTGAPQGATTDGAAPVERVMSCDCVRQINAEALPDVNTAINGLTSSVDELFKLADATEISPVSVRHICFFCGRIRRYRKRVHGWHYNKHHYNHHNYHHGHHYWKRQADGGSQSAPAPACPIDEVVATGQTAQEGTQLVNEVIAGIRADPKEVNQDLLDDITALYNEVNESVKNLQTATDPNSTECSQTGENDVSSDVAFPGEG